MIFVYFAFLVVPYGKPMSASTWREAQPLRPWGFQELVARGVQDCDPSPLERLRFFILLSKSQSHM